MDDWSRALSCSHAEDSPAFAVNAVSIAAPEKEDVDDIQVAHAGRCEQSGLALLVTVVHVRLVLQQDLTHSGLPLECRNEERSHAVTVSLVGVGSVI